MSYQVLARKWRPQRFEEITGQHHVATPLRNAIRLGRVPHAILLTGPRGVGKTTIARIFARCLNCAKGPTDTPCGECDSCRQIAAGTSTDVQELDAASRTGVDDVREWIEAVRYAPSPGKHRIFVVDEVHMLSASAFNALLKTLEEPPPRSLFLFATTNPEKIPFTVVSRCQRYDLRRLSSAEITHRLAAIAEQEGIEISPASLGVIARESDGSLRDALTLLDQVVSYGGPKVEDACVAEVLDLVDRRIVLAILEACVKGDPAGSLDACGRAATAGIDARRLGAVLLRSLRDLVVLRIVPDQPGLVDGSDAEIAELRALAQPCEPTRLRRMFRALLKEQEDLAWAPEPFAVLEMAVVRLATLSTGEDAEALLARLDALERRLRGGPDSGDPAGGDSAPSGPSAPRRGRRPGPTLPEAPQAAPPAEPGPDATFERIRAFVREEDPGLFAALDGAQVVEQAEGRLHVALPHAFALQRLERRRPRLAELCSRLLGHPIELALSGPPACASEREPAGEEAERLRQRRRAALRHPSVNDALELLGGEVVEIRPLGREP